MAGYAKLVRSIWNNDDFRALTGSQQRTFMLLFSQPDISHCGVLSFTPGRWGTLALDTNALSIRADVRALEVAEFVVIDPETEELWVRSYMKWDEGYRVPNIAKAVVSAVESVVSKPLRTAIASAARTLGVTLSATLDQAVAPSLQPTPTPAAAAATVTPSAGARTWTEVAAAATELYIAHRVAQVQPKNVSGFELTLRREIPDEWGPRLNAYINAHIGCSEHAVLRDVFKVTIPGSSDDIALAAAGSNFGLSIAALHVEDGMVDRDGFLSEIADRPEAWRDAAIATYDEHTKNAPRLRLIQGETL